MATTQYKDNAGNIHEFQEELGDAGGAEKRPVAGMPAAVRSQFTSMVASLSTIASLVGGTLKVVIETGTAVIGKLAPNAGVNIGTVDVNSGSVSITGALPAVALAPGNNNIGDVDVASLPTLPQLPATVGAKTAAASLSVVLASDHGTQGVNLTAALPAGNNNIGDVDVASLPTLPQLPTTIGQKTKAASLSVTQASDQAPSGATVALVANSTSAVTIKAANASRVGLIVVNDDDTATLYLRFGSGATVSDWSVPIEPHGHWEMPPRYYSGIVTGIWSGSTFGNAHVTETA